MRTSYCNECKQTVRFYSDFGPGKSMIYICGECDSELNNNFKLCLLAAGRGTRNKHIDGLHKSLLPLENKPVISHIIENFHKDIEIVVAVGYKSEQIKSYLDEVHSDRKITYVEIDNYDGDGSGPGYSLLSCKDELKTPFIFTSIDTIITDVKEKDPDRFTFLNENWIGVSDVNIAESLSYCLVSGNDYLDNLYFGKGNRAFIGMAGILDYENFWKNLADEKYNTEDDLHEFQVMSGFEKLDKIKLVNFNWHDTGNNKSYEQTKEFFKNDIVANKSDEAIFIDSGKVIKYFDDSNRARIRVDRAKCLDGNVPKVNLINNNMYSYDFVNGELLSNVLDENVLNNFLDFCNKNLWEETFVNDDFLDDCKVMYEDKTKERLSKLIDTNLDKIKKINGVEVESISNLLGKIKWDKIYENAKPSLFHGDLQPENIIYNLKDDKFVLIDWREGFGNNTEVGDVYYDLSKLYHALLINGDSILKGMYDYKIKSDTASVNFYAKSNLIYFMGVFEKWCKDNDYNWECVELLGILHYLNICTLYDNFQNGDYGKFLFLYGKYLLTKHLNKA